MTILLKKDFYLHAIFPLLWLSLPLILSGLVESSISFFSTIFLAHLGSEALAAGALVNWVFATIMVILWGTLTAVSVLVAQKYGAKDERGISLILRDGILLGLIFVIPTFLLLWYMAPIFLLLGQSPDIASLAQIYLHALAWGVLPDFIMLVLLQFLIGLGRTHTSMFFMLLWVPIAVFCIYILIFGTFGLPALGIAGIGWGMTASYWIITLMLVIYLLINPSYQSYRYKALSVRGPFYLKELLRIGLPMGIMYCIEVGFFLAFALLMGSLGTDQLAAAQITFQYLGQFVAIVFSIAQAISVRIGHQLAQNNKDAVFHTTYAGIYISVFFMMIALIAYVFFSDMLIALDLNMREAANAKIIIYTRQFLIICAIFQLLEAVRIALFGALRALHDTHFTLWTSVLSFWLIALPLGYGLTQTLLGSIGLWWGLVIGGFFSVLLLGWRFNSKLKAPLPTF